MRPQHDLKLPCALTPIPRKAGRRPAALLPRRQRRASAVAAAAATEAPPRRVVVTGQGVVSSLGHDPDEFYNNLLAGKSGVSMIEGWDTGGRPRAAEGRQQVVFQYLKRLLFQAQRSQNTQLSIKRGFSVTLQTSSGARNPLQYCTLFRRSCVHLRPCPQRTSARGLRAKSRAWTPTGTSSRSGRSG